MALIDELGFDTSFSFVYSRRPGTPAADLPDETQQDVKVARLQRLQAAINRHAASISDAMLGTRQQVLVEGPSKRDASELTGRTANNRIVNFAGSPDLVGRMTELQITQVFAHSLRGRLERSDTKQAA